MRCTENAGSRAPARAGRAGLAAWLVFSFALPVFAQPRGPRAASVVVARVQKRDVLDRRVFTGTVHGIRKSIVGSEVEGRVVEMLVREGDRVAGGQTLAQLRAETVKIELAAAKAQLLLRRHELAELKAGSLPAEKDQAKARMEKARASMKLALATKARRTHLYESSRSVSKEELDLAGAGADTAAQALLDAQAALKLVNDGPRREKIDQAEARVAAQQEEVKRLDDILGKYTIVAPFDGYVTAERTEMGQWVAKGGPIVELVDLDTVDVHVNVQEDYLANLRVGMAAWVELDALADRAFDGKVAVIVPQADTRSRSFPVKVRLPNPNSGDGRLLAAGMLVRVTLAVGEKKQALLVPKDALVLDKGNKTVWVVDADPEDPKTAKAREIPVRTGAMSGSLVEILGAVEEGRQVVVEGNERLRAGRDGTAMIRVAETVETPSKNPQ